MKHLTKIRFTHQALAFLVLVSFLFSATTQATNLRIPQGDNSLENYAQGLLKLALSKIPDEYELTQSVPTTSEERMISLLVDNQLDVVWYATTNELEEKLLPIRICIYRGLLGQRVLMIKKGTQQKFEGIKTLDDLKKVSMGQGRFWADASVLAANQLNVVKVLKYEGLFHMLDGDRFDAFPRGVHEPWSEMKRYPHLALDVEQNLLLSYVNPFYFFVNKSNTKLASDIETGLRMALEDGSFNEYFLNDQTVRDVVENANLKHRINIALDNPSLPPKTPIHDKSLWFDPQELQ